MIRAVLLAALAAALGGALWLASARAPRIALVDAVASPMAGQPGLWMVEMTIRNEGPPDRLLGVRGEGQASLGNEGASGLAVIVPGGDEAQLAMDGAHAMLMSSEGAGALVPLTLLFDRAGDVATRVRLSPDAAMDHGAMAGVAEDPAPKVRLSAPAGVSGEGFTVALETEGIAFRQVEEGTAHVPGEGHAHLYLNGLKLGRAYADTMGIGALPAGRYRLEVVLNAHDHRPYLGEDGTPVGDVLDFEIP